MSGERILVVDDDPVSRDVISTLLAATGYEVVEASDGLQALAAARSEPVDLAISDILMPRMDGYRFALEWNSDPGLSSIPLIFYTASYTDPADRELADELGVARFVLKPQDPQELLRIIAEVLEGSARAAEDAREEREAREEDTAPDGGSREVGGGTPAAGSVVSVAEGEGSEAPEEGEAGERGERADRQVAVLEQYSVRLVKKLEEKMAELQRSNRELRRARERLSHEVEAKNRAIEELNRDIEERERVQAELRRERDFTSQVIEVSELVIVALDMEGRIELFSKGAEVITGHPADEVAGRDFVTLLVPEHARDRHRHHFDMLRDGVYPLRSTDVIVTKGGRERIVDWSESVRTDEQGRVTGILVFGLDVTESVHSRICESVLSRLNDAVLFGHSIDDALEDLCARLADALHLKGVVLVLTREDGLVESTCGGPLGDVAEGACILGSGAEEPLRRSIDEERAALVDPSDPAWRGTDDGPETRGVGALLSVPLSAYGTTRGALAFCAASPAPFDEGLVDTLRYCAERVAQALVMNEREQELRLQSEAITSATSAIAVTDGEGRFMWANPMHEALTGYASEELEGEPYAVLADVADDEEAAWESLARGETVDEERVSVRQDGSEFQEEVSFAPVLDGGGAIQNIIVVRQDVTERRRLEQMRSDLMDAVSHELRSPLTNIIGYSDLVLGLDSPDMERTRHFAGKIRMHAEHMNRLVEELLQISRLQHGTRPAEIERVDLGALLRHQVDSVTLPEGHDLRLEAPEDGIDLPCEPTWISTAIGNLIDNAIKYSPDGGTISIVLEEGDGWVTVSVSDEGIGIEERDAEQIFERFTQADMSTTRRFGGFGLGLAIVKDVVAAHGGDIEVDSVPGEGSTFTVRLPRRPTEGTPD